MKSYRSWFPAYCTGEAVNEENEEYHANKSFFLTDDEDINITLHVDCKEINQTSRSVPHANMDHVEVLQRAKMYLQTIDEISYRELRNEANRYEGLGKGCFLNRSAMKLVNLDFEFALIPPYYPTEEYEEEKDQQQRVFTFVDLCGGPGGFIEYCVLKCRHERIRCMGFGMTLLIPNDGITRVSMRSCNWNITHLHDPPLSEIRTLPSQENNPMMTEMMMEHGHTIDDGTNNDCPIQVYLVDGVTGTGDITKTENIASLQSLIRQRLASIPLSISSYTHTTSSNESMESSNMLDHHHDPMKYVDFCSADGFDSDMEETFVLVLCQVIAMLSCLNNGGNFVIKVFTCDQPHALCLFVLLSQLFEEVILTKPVTSRPISGERFLTAFRLRECVTEGIRQMVIDHLWVVCQRIESWITTQQDHDTIIPTLCNQQTEEKHPDRLFVIMQWPFVMSDTAIHGALHYLSAVNGHHLLVQLIESYKILSTALDRGLLGTKQGIDSTLLIYPHPMGPERDNDKGISSGEGDEISMDILQLVESLGNIRVREAGMSSGSSTHPTKTSGGKKKKKKKRGNKMMMMDMGEPVDDPTNVSLPSDDIETVFMTTTTTSSSSSSSTTTTTATAATTTTTTPGGDNSHTTTTQKSSPYQTKIPIVNDGCRSIKDIVRQEQMSKPLRVHEYYKLWGIYELDVVY